MGCTLNEWLISSVIAIGVIILCVAVALIWSFIDYRKMERWREKMRGKMDG